MLGIKQDNKIASHIFFGEQVYFIYKQASWDVLYVLK